MTIGCYCQTKEEKMREDEELGMETSLTMSNESTEVALLLSRVRAVITDARCADRLDAERWLNMWLDTPNAAFDNRRLGLK